MPYIQIQSEHALKVFFDAPTAEESATDVSNLCAHLKNQFNEDIVDLIPSYTSIAMIVDFPRVYPQTIAAHIESLYANESPLVFLNEALNKKLHELPIYYGLSEKWDTQFVAGANSLSLEAVIDTHSSRIYKVYAIGFSPGFPYLGFVDHTIATPRRAEPRVRVPQGAVGIAENQTGIYSQPTPGGWNIIGRCPSILFHAPSENSANASQVLTRSGIQHHNLSVLKVGDEVKFKSIGEDEYTSMTGESPELGL